MQTSLDMFAAPVLRPYQQAGIDELREAIRSGAKRVLMVGPTGGGKTVVAASIIRSAVARGKRVLFLAHRIELINQAKRQVEKFGVLDVGVIRADDARANPEAQVQVASVQTLNRRPEPLDFDIVFVDEAHSSMADSYRNVVSRFPKAIVIGLTATPFRQDNKGLGEIFEQLIVFARPSQLVEDGFIIAPRAYGAPAAPDLTDVKVTAGDFNARYLEAAMVRGKLVGNTVQEWLRLAAGRKTVLFAVSIEHSRLLCKTFQDEGVAAAHIDAHTDGDTRALTLHRLNTGELSVVCNVDVLTEGWDQPSVKCAILARPTKSLRVHLQQVGRILRPFEGQEAIILDHAGNCDLHGMPHWDREFSLEYGQGKKPDITLHTCKKCFAMWTGASRACPSCGEEREHTPRELPESVDGMGLVSRETSEQTDPKRVYFQRMAHQARTRGWKPGAASARYKEQFGEWPPWAWSQSLKMAYELDVAWQEDVRHASERREYWQSKKVV